MRHIAVKEEQYWFIKKEMAKLGYQYFYQYMERLLKTTKK